MMPPSLCVRDQCPAWLCFGNDQSLPTMIIQARFFASSIMQHATWIVRALAVPRRGQSDRCPAWLRFGRDQFLPTTIIQARFFAFSTPQHATWIVRALAVPRQGPKKPSSPRSDILIPCCGMPRFVPSASSGMRSLLRGAPFDLRNLIRTRGRDVPAEIA